MALVAKDLNVFDLPHNRMKRLVGEIEKQVLSTNFSDEESYYNLLDTLDDGFDELLSHEAIEDHYIIHPLLPRLPSTVKVTLQNDVHSDNRLSVLHEKIKKQLGMSIVSHSERLHFGEELQEELFGLKLIPHMDEEEEVFQPLLLQYFTQQELRNIKQIVIKLHNLPDCDHSETAEITPPILQLPLEIILKVFRYLSPRDLCRCAQVNVFFSKIAFDGTLWQHLHPVKWLTGEWRFHLPTAYDEGSLEELASNGCEDEQEISNHLPTIQPLYDFVCNLLPKVGAHVSSLSLAHAGRMEIKYLYQALSLCPNLISLDLSYTSASDFAFTGLLRNHLASKLEYLNLSGCNWISDLTLERLAKAFRPSMKYTGINAFKTSENNNKCLSSANKCTCKEFQDSLCEKPRLCCLRLSGCHLITDKGLRAMASVGIFSYLKFLDFSGIHKITANGLEAFLQMCPNIRPDMLFYCDDIVDGPYSTVANGCQNIDSTKICCRNF